MRRNGKKTAVKIVIWLIFIGLLAAWGMMNYRKLKDNSYSNYEKALDYGFIKYNRKNTEGVLIAVFYGGNKSAENGLATFYNHSVVSDWSQAKILLLPETMNGESYKLIQNFYKKIAAYNDIKQIVLVSENRPDLQIYEQLNADFLPETEIKTVLVPEDAEADSSEIESCVAKDKCLLVFVADVRKIEDNRLVNDAVYYAQNAHLQVSVVDIYDEQLFSAYENGRPVAEFLSDTKDEVTLHQQKINLEQYITQYGKQLLQYFAANLKPKSEEQKLVLPEKNEENYRLFDRAAVYVKAYDAEYNPVFSQFENNQENAVVATLAGIAENATSADKNKIIRYFEIYFLTDAEKVIIPEDADVSGVLDPDDGLYVAYEGKNSLMLENERPLLTENTVRILKEKAGIGSNVGNEQLMFFRFKSVEIDYDVSKGENL